jgi:hypothetical protein
MAKILGPMAYRIVTIPLMGTSDSARAPGRYRASDFSPVVSFLSVARTLLAGPATTIWQ